ncbi:MAG: flavodoxin family protein [Firmicutes bacterium]|nr:flavodoxin family protein [Bacillota bacterium]
MGEDARSVKLQCLALACSPRKDGNTALLAREALEACREEGHDTEFLYLADFNYFPCRACDGCFNTGKCVVPDQAGTIFEKILAADRFIMAAPVFSLGICAQAKMLIDRTQQFWAAKYLLDRHVPGKPSRRGIFISCAGTTLPKVFEGTLQTVRYFFKILDIDLAGNYCYDGVDKKGDILSHPRAMRDAGRQGKALVRTEWQD